MKVDASKETRNLDKAKSFFSGTSWREITSILTLELFVLSIVVPPLLVSSQPSSSPTTFYFGTVTSSPLTSISATDPNFLAGRASISVYGLQYQQLAWFNASSGGYAPDLASSWSYFFLNKSIVANVTWTDGENVTTVIPAGVAEVIMHIRPNTYWVSSTGQKLFPVTSWDVWATTLILSLVGGSPYNVTVVNNQTVIMWFYGPYATGLPIRYNVTVLLCTVGMQATSLFIPYPLWKPLVYNVSKYYYTIQQLFVGNPANGTILKILRQQLRNYVPSNYLYSNGPYYVSQITPSEIVWSKNPYYWAADKFPFDQIIEYQFTGGSAFQSALISGLLDLAFATYPPSVASEILSNPNMRLISSPATGGLGLMFNFRAPYMNITQVRQAIAYIINRTEVADIMGSPYSPVPYPETIPDDNLFAYLNTPDFLAKLNPYNTNSTMAAKLLESVGFTQKNGQWYAPNGKPFQVIIAQTAGASIQEVDAVDVIVSELNNFGIQAQLEIYPASEQNSLWSSGQGYSAWWLGYSAPLPEITNFFEDVKFFNGYPNNVTGWNSIVTLPNGTKINIQTLYAESPNTTAQYIQLEQELGYLENYYLWMLALVNRGNQIWINVNGLSWPPANSTLWQEAAAGFTPGQQIWFWVMSGQLKPSPTTTTSTSATTVTTTSVSTTTTTATSVTTTTAVSTTTSVSTTTAVSTTTSVATSVTTSLLTSVSSIVTTVTSGIGLGVVIAVIAVLIVVIAVIAYLLLRRR